MIQCRSLLALVLIFLSAGAMATTPSAEKLANDFEKAKELLLKDEIAQRQVMGSLYGINKSMKKTVTEKSDLEQEKLLVQAQTKELAGKVLEMGEKLKTQKSMLRFRLSAIYRLGGQGLARLLLTSQDSTHLERNLKILGVVAKKDLELIKDYNAAAKDLDKKRIKFTTRLAHLKVLEEKIIAKEKILVAENRSKSKLIENLRKSKQTALTQIKKLRVKSAQANLDPDETEMLDLLLRPSFFEKKGKLPLPVNGKVLRGFGLLRESGQDVVLSHKGIYFGTAQAAPVRAVSEGRVAFAGVVAGYGQTVIVDHGDHYYSVYAQAGHLEVHEGDEVKQNQTLAVAGLNDEQTNGIYFEIRHFSEPSDPRQWMKGSFL